MADLVAIGCPDEVTAEAAADEVRRPAADLTTHHAVGEGAVCGMVWGPCSACCSSSRSSGRPWAPGWTC